jgi:hypothetical protein
MDQNHRNLNATAVREDKFIFTYMIKNNKVFELKIEEDDELSGIDSISLVDEPAIEVNWIAFNKEKEHEFHIPDGEDDKYIEKLVSIAQDEQELFDEGWVVNKVEVVGQNHFVSTDPNGPSEEDEKEYNVRYKYILNPKISQSPIINTTRSFCKTLINRNYVWRIEDMEKTQNDFGDSAMVWRGGFNCRHVWARIEYKKDATIVNKASVNKGKVTIGGFPTDMIPDTRVLGMEQPSTVTSKTAANPSPSTVKNLGLSKVYDFVAQKVSIDYDDTLSTDRGKELAKRLLKEGKDVSIITRRQSDQLDAVRKVADELGIPQDKVHATDGKLKWETIKKLGIEKHIDNNSKELEAIAKNLPNVETEKFDYEVGGIGGYVNPNITGDTISKSLLVSTVTCKECGWEWEIKDGGEDPYICHKCGCDNSPSKNMFESHSDYPESVKNNAKSVLKYVEENGWGSCGTDVGKQRANQLAKGEPISEDTIRRMYSYLSRHEKDLESSKGYGDGCGKLMYDSWGGKTALSWAESKINTFNKQKMSKQAFQTDEEKKIVLGPAMIPDLQIFRRDGMGNPYYVYFSAPTIKMIAEKYMRNKYIDNNDQMHDGKAVKDVYVVESWIKESENDKSTDYGYGELPIGTWFVSMKVNNPDIWAKVKEGFLNGFSVSGYFEEVAQFCMEEMFLKQVAEILKNVKD